MCGIEQETNVKLCSSSLNFCLFQPKQFHDSMIIYITKHSVKPAIQKLTGKNVTALRPLLLVW